MKLLVVGGGGREHAIIRKLLESPKVERIYCAPGNGGISCDAQCVDINAMDKESMVTFAKQNGIDFAVVAPDDPLAAGMVDAMEEAGIPAFGPTAKPLLLIESSKVFSKNLMKQYGIPTAGYEVFDDSASAIAYIEQNNTFPIVVKADGLALGKGVIIAENLQAAKERFNQLWKIKFLVSQVIRL